MQPDNAKPMSDLYSSILASQLQEKGKLGLGPWVGNVPTASVQKSFMLCFLGLDMELILFDCLHKNLNSVGLGELSGG